MLLRTIHLIYIIGVGGIELEDVVVDLHQGTEDVVPSNESGVAQHAYPGIRAIAVSHTDSVVDNGCKVGVSRRLAIAGKGKHVGNLTLSKHGAESLLKGSGDFLPRGTRRDCMPLAVGAALAVYAVEIANFSVSRHKIYAKRQPKPATMYRTVDG